MPYYPPPPPPHCHGSKRTHSPVHSQTADLAARALRWWKGSVPFDDPPACLPAGIAPGHESSRVRHLWTVPLACVYAERCLREWKDGGRRGVPGRRRGGLNRCRPRRDRCGAASVVSYTNPRSVLGRFDDASGWSGIAKKYIGAWKTNSHTFIRHGG